jgi:cell division protein FtsW
MFRTVGERTTLNSQYKNSRKRLHGSTHSFSVSSVVDTFERLLPQEKPISGHRFSHLKFDVLLAMAVITLIIFGLLMVYSASYDYSWRWRGISGLIFQRQLLWMAIGLVVATVLSFLDYHYWRNLAVIAMIVTIVALIVVLVIGEKQNNAIRAIVGSSGQPSELAKLVTVIYLSVWLFAKKDQLSNISFGLLPLSMILGLVGGLIFLQPDISAVITVLFLGGTMFFLAGGDMRQIGLLLVFAFLFGLLVVQFSPTGSLRVHDYFLGLKDPAEGSYHVKRSFEAFLRGGWFGSGIGNAKTKLTGLPVPPTDSIFAVVGEETGVIGAISLVCVYVVFLWRGLVIAKRAPDEMGALLAAGLTLWITTEAFINMAVMVGLLPFAGNALPLVSAGGSNLLVTLSAIGILLNISLLSERRREKDGSTYNAVVDLRGRDRRRRVSSVRRPAGHGLRDPRQTRK